MRPKTGSPLSAPPERVRASNPEAIQRLQPEPLASPGSLARKGLDLEESVLLKPIKRVRLYENAVEQIQSLILKNDYKPKDRLPPERSLAEQLNISRPSLREALRILSVMGLIEIKVGDGIYVKDVSFLPYIESVNLSISSRLQMEQDSLLKLWQVRKILEVGMVDLLEGRITIALLKSLWHSIEEMGKNIDDQDAFISSGIRFHRVIAEAGQNEILILIWDTLGDLIRKSHDRIYRISRTPSKSLRSHKKIYDALKKRDVPKAAEAMKKHMAEEEEALLAAIAKVKG
jgi:GntR family transcriptional regulator, transcriptional repressor for pyruvate dehydrogenase complex